MPCRVVSVKCMLKKQNRIWHQFCVLLCKRFFHVKFRKKNIWASTSAVMFIILYDDQTLKPTFLVHRRECDTGWKKTSRKERKKTGKSSSASIHRESLKSAIDFWWDFQVIFNFLREFSKPLFETMRQFFNVYFTFNPRYSISNDIFSSGRLGNFSKSVRL